MSLNDVCRACLCTDRRMCSVFEAIVPNFDSPPKSVWDLWKFFKQILIVREARFPDKICMECVDEIQQTYSFVLKCQKSEEIFKNVRICVRNVKIIYLNNDPKNTKSENDISPNILQNDSENIESSYECDEGDTDEGQLELIIDGNIDQVDPLSQHTFQDEDDNLEIELLDPLDDVGEDEVSAKPGHELGKRFEDDKFDEVESEDASSNEILNCPACRYECRTMESLENHLIEKHMKKQMCKICNKEFDCEPVEHCSVHLHISGAEGVFKSTNIKLLKCKVCTKIFKYECHLKRHLLIHTAERPFNCDICIKTFKQKHDLTRHLMCHTGERPFKCKICPKAFGRKTLLKEHFKSHIGVRPFKCEICPTAYRYKISLTDHLKCHTGEIPYKCEICRKTFQTKNSLTQHSKLHTGEKQLK